MIELEIPIAEEAISSLKVGDSVSLSGIIVTARDAAHKFMIENFIDREPPESEKALYDELSQLPRRRDTDFLFPAPGNPSKPETFQKSWGRAVQQAKIRDFRFHDLRHTVASYMAMSGASEREIAEVLGHGQEFLSHDKTGIIMHSMVGGSHSEENIGMGW